jgi:hypothetical protein
MITVDMTIERTERSIVFMKSPFPWNRLKPHITIMHAHTCTDSPVSVQVCFDVL